MKWPDGSGGISVRLHVLGRRVVAEDAERAAEGVGARGHVPVRRLDRARPAQEHAVLVRPQGADGQLLPLAAARREEQDAVAGGHRGRGGQAARSGRQDGGRGAPLQRIESLGSRDDAQAIQRGGGRGWTPSVS